MTGGCRRKKRRRMKYKDVEHVKEGRRGNVPKDWAERHRKRHAAANGERQVAIDAFEALGAAVQIHNQGHHWMIRFPDGDHWEWWPSSAKLVRNKAWKKGIHVHSWRKVKETIESRRNS